MLAVGSGHVSARGGLPAKKPYVARISGVSASWGAYIWGVLGGGYEKISWKNRGACDCGRSHGRERVIDPSDGSTAPCPNRALPSLLPSDFVGN